MPECEDEDTFVTEIEKFKVQQESQPSSQISNPPINEVVWNFNEETPGKLTNHKARAYYNNIKWIIYYYMRILNFYTSYKWTGFLLSSYYFIVGYSNEPMGYDEVDMGGRVCVGCKRTDSRDSLTLQPCRCSCCDKCLDDLTHCPSCNTKVRAAAKTN